MDHTIDNDTETETVTEIKAKKEEQTEKQTQATPAPVVEEKPSASEDFKSKYYYLAAEMENVKRRYEREKEAAIKYGNQQILTDLLEILDNFDRSLESMRSTPSCEKGLLIGIEMVHNQFYQILARYGLTPVNTSGETFNPQYHEAMGRKVVDDKKEDEILEVYQKGYCLNGRLIRSAKVVVAVSAP